MKWIFVITVCWCAIPVFGCSQRPEDDEVDSETATGLRVSTDTDSVADSVIGSETASVANETDSGVNIDTADGVGGSDEECYTYDNNDSILMWCDTPDMVMQQCEDYASGCCCRAPCAPAMCDGVTETLPCTVYDTQNLMGYCDYTVDNVPVAYECKDVCTPRSICINIDTDGDCLDSEAGLVGVCLFGGEEDNVQLYCQPSCTVSVCDDTHFCSPLYENGVYDGTGACLLR